MGKIRLSQCMIVKNEEKNIEKALSWGKDIVFEQIVVDTGSTDRTVEIAKAMGAKIFHFEWISDFSAAKNFAMDQATGDWIAFLDADEYFREEDVGKILPMLERLEKNRKRGEMAEAVLSDLICLDDEGRPFLDAVQIRLIRNQKNIRYHNRIHEQVKVKENDNLRKAAGVDATGQLTIIHTGYSKTAYAETGKLERNAKMLEAEVNDDPKNWEMMVYLGETLCGLERREDANRWFFKVLEEGIDKTDDWSQNMLFKNLLKNLMERKRAEDETTILEVYKKAKLCNCTNPDFDYFLGIWCFGQRRWAEAFQYMQQALANMDQKKGTQAFMMPANLNRFYHDLTVICLNLQRYPDVVRYGVLCLRADPYMGDILIILLGLLKEEAGEQESASGTLGILSRIYDFGNLKDKLFIRKCAQNAGFEKLCSIAESYLTEAERDALNAVETH